jgi:hypothetical protein
VFDEPEELGLSVDHGSRAASVKAKVDAMKEESERHRKRERFASALSKADERSHTLLDQPSADCEDDSEDIILQVVLSFVPPSDVLSHCHDVQESLEKARRAALKKQAKGHGAVFVAVSKVSICLRYPGLPTFSVS